MMLWPQYQETFVLPYQAEEAQRLLSGKVRMALQLSRRKKRNMVFIGRVDDGRFSLSPIVRSSPAFSPYIFGSIESTSKGCIVWVRYRLLVEAQMFLILWMAICAGLVLFFILLYQAYLSALLSGLFGASNYLITMGVFRLHLKRSREEINRIFNPATDME